MNLDILKIASDTNNNKSIKNYTHHSKLKNSMCGDEMQIDLVIKKNKIIDFGYQGKSCVCLLYTSPSPRDVEESRMPSSA